MKVIYGFVMWFCSFGAIAQEFGQQFLTIGEESFNQGFKLENTRFVQQFGEISIINSVGITQDNYWNAVSMADAYAKEEAYLNRKSNRNQKVINSESLGFGKPAEKEKTFKVEIRDGRDYLRSSRFRNSVYRDASGIPYYLNPHFYNLP